MSMKLSQLRTYWSADDAHLIISFLDELRETLWATHTVPTLSNNGRRKSNKKSTRMIDNGRWIVIRIVRFKHALIG